MRFWEWLFNLLFGRRTPAAPKKPAPAPQPRDQAPPPMAPPAPQPRDQAPPPIAPPPLAPPPAPQPPLQPPPPAAPPPMAPPGGIPAFSLALGCVDPSVTQAACQDFITGVERMTERELSSINAGPDKVRIDRIEGHPAGAMTVAQVQDGLRALGFFPGGEVDGIYGYRTTSAVRLFQEYVRQYLKQDVTPDGVFGPKTQAHLQSWLSAGRRPDWGQTPGEYDRWLGFLEQVKAHHLASPSMEVAKVSSHDGKTNSLKVPEWDFSGPNNIHLIGVRRKEFTGKFDDVFILLIKGLVFKFQGSTEPGATDNPKGMPFLMPGQHIYKFGWHQSTYLALRPLPHGALVVRAGANNRLEPSDYNAGLETNPTINIHWAGRGLDRNVGTWSHGCQVITGGLYITPSGELADCRKFAAINNGDLANRGKTRGAYNVIVDLVTALSGDMPSNVVRYMLLTEADMMIEPALAQQMKTARDRVVDEVT